MMRRARDMKIAITQPNYIPWLGYFALLAKVDLWVSLDNVQVTRRSYLTRNRVKRSDEAAEWLTVPLLQCSQKTLIRDARLDPVPFGDRHWAKIESYYRRAPAFHSRGRELCALLRRRDGETFLHEYNERVLGDLCQLIGIAPKTIRASSLVADLVGTAQEKLLALAAALQEKAELYCFSSGVEAGLYDPHRFREAGIVLWKQEYQHPRYAQIGSGFMHHLSIVDLLLNQDHGLLATIESGDHWVAM